jgi:thiol-disulfide isomerase/thioredoxin
MRFLLFGALLVSNLTAVAAQQTSDGPTDEKAQKTYQDALKLLQEGRKDFAVDGFKKADKQDGGHCLACQKKMIKYGIEVGDWKAAELASEEMVAEAKDPRETAVAHYQFGVVLLDEGSQKHKDEYFSRAHGELTKALAAYASFPDAIFLDGRALASLHQDDAAKARFEEYLKLKPGDGPDHQRAVRFLNRPELARARMAPPFAVTTLDGKHISMDELQGKVVLLDFWATWCGPCREALPHIRDVAKKFQGQPLVILSVSLDNDEEKWKDFVAKNDMTWPQYRDGGFTGSIAKMFSVTAIPHTFTIDADGVLQEEHIGDASIEGKLKKLIAHARELQPADAPAK